MKPRKLHRQQQQGLESPQLPQQRIFFIIFSVVSAAAFFYIWWSVPPADIQNVVIDNSYLPLLVAVFVFCATCIGLFTSWVRGVVYGFVLTVFLFLRLHQIQGSLLLIALLFPVIISDLILTFRKQP